MAEQQKPPRDVNPETTTKRGLDRIVRESADLVERGGKAPPDGRLASGGPDVSRRKAGEQPADVMGGVMRELGRASVKKGG